MGLGKLVPRKGLEPSRPLSHWHLKPARLPIPPPGPGRVSTDLSHACHKRHAPVEIYFCVMMSGQTFLVCPEESRRPHLRIMRKCGCTALTSSRIAEPH